MAQAGITARDDGTVVVTVIFERHELEAYVEQADQVEQAAPIDPGAPPTPADDETAPPDEPEPEPEPTE